VATGFDTYDPVDKPYGYGVLPNVVTSLELDRVLRRHHQPLRPSDWGVPERIAFIQCVGSRDAQRNRLWCSKYCCGFSLRAANLVRYRNPETELTVFYMDLQTFGGDFEAFFAEVCGSVRMIRAIPGDIYPAPEDGLRVTYLDPESSETLQEDFDLVVLAVGMAPCEGSVKAAEGFGLRMAEGGFAGPEAPLEAMYPDAGVFTAGAAGGPMTILESVTSARKAAQAVLDFLRGNAYPNPSDARETS
jgi:heterodisulfide reductase subunit A